MLPLYLKQINSLKIVLGSTSPARKELLEMVGLKFEILASKYAEDLPFEGYTPENYVKEIARRKLDDVREQLKALNKPADLIISGDTLIHYEGKLFCKPKDKQDAFNMLKTLCGHTHQCITAAWIGLVNEKYEFVDTAAVVVSTDLTFYPLSDAEIKAYVDTEQPMNNSGSYMLQAHGATLYSKLNGCFYAVWGFPLNGFAQMLIPMLKKNKIIPSL